MSLPTILAHGALGSFDELIYLGIAVVFVVIMAVSWLRSRNSTLEAEEDEVAEKPREVQDSPDRFKLD